MVVICVVIRIQRVGRLTLTSNRIRQNPKIWISGPSVFPVGQLHSPLNSKDEVYLEPMPIPSTILIRIWSKKELAPWPRKSS